MDSHAAKFMASLQSVQKDSVTSLMTASDVLGGAVETLRASGVNAFSIAVVLALEMKKIADTEGWSDAMQKDFLAPALRQLVAPVPGTTCG